MIKKENMNNEPNVDALLFYFKHQNWQLLLQESQKILNNYPHYYFAHHTLGIAYFYLNQLEKATTAFQKAYHLNPNDSDLLKNYITALLKLKREKEAIVYLEQLISLINNTEEKKHYFIQLAQIQSKCKMPFAAMLNYANAVALDPKNSLLLNDFACSLLHIGENIEAENVLNESLKCAKNKEEEIKVKTLKLIEAPYFHNSTPKKLKQIALDYYQMQKYEPLFSFKKEENIKTLKIGFVSGDFNFHVVSFFVEEWLKESKNLNLNLEFYAYSARNFEDLITEKLKPLFKKFTPIFHLNDMDAAQIIFKDGIHILGDLSGHTAFSRLGIFKHRPAPVSFSAIGWLGSSASVGVDYIFGDSIVEPFDESTEKVFVLPSVFQVFSKKVDFPPVSISPFLKNAYFTFGAFQAPIKVNRQAIFLWCEVLNNIPTARFLWAHGELKEAAFCAHILGIFMENGVNPNRVRLVGNKNRMQYLHLHNEVDVILDTLPATSATTLVEALLMGVPTMSILGKTRAGRFAASFLHAAGLDDFICENQTQFLNRLKTLTNLEQSKAHPLAILRQKLRYQTLQSPLTDSALYARQMEKAFFKMYADFLKDENPR